LARSVARKQNVRRVQYDFERGRIIRVAPKRENNNDRPSNFDNHSNNSNHRLGQHNCLKDDYFIGVRGFNCLFLEIILEEINPILYHFSSASAGGLKVDSTVWLPGKPADGAALWTNPKSEITKDVR
jgi:hypothetical protein